jgi:hypothetical protein
MASSGKVTVSVTSWDNLVFEWKQESQSVQNNSTVVAWTLKLVAGSSGAIFSTADKAWRVTVDGATYSGTNTVAISNNTTRTLASGRTTIVHDEDGGKRFSFSFSQEFAITFSGSQIGTKSGSGSGTLNTIARATTPTLSASTATMGNSITIHTPRASSAFTHDLAYSFEGGSYVSIATGVATSRAWTVPDLVSQIPNETSGVMRIRCVTKNGSTTIGTKTVNLTVKVPAATSPTLSASSADMGVSVTIRTPRLSTGYTHDLAYSFAGSGYTSIATGVATSRSWTIPDLASSIPNATSGTVTIRCVTKNGTKTIGTKTVLLTAKVPASVVPTISGVTTTEAVDGIAAQFGAFIQSKSKVKVAITVAGAKGSTIKSISSTFLGRTYTGASWTSATISGSGTAQIRTTVTDSRGRKVSVSTPVTALAYTRPAVTAFQVWRANADGTPAEDGVYALLRYVYAVARLGNKNTASMRVTWKQSTAEEYEGTAVWTSSQLAQDITNLAEHLTFSTDSSYDFQITVTDWFGETAIYSAQMPTGHVIMDLLADGTGVSFGKVAELSNTADFGMQVRTNAGTLQPLLQEGADFNQLKAPNVYTVQNVGRVAYLNCPLTSGTASLRVEAVGEEGQIRQIITTCNKTKPRSLERFFYQDSWGDWLPVHKGGSERVLWTGALFMNGNQSAPLSEKVSAQPNGVVLIFSTYENNAANDFQWVSHFVPKELLTLGGTGGFTVSLAEPNFARMSTKYLYLKDDRIEGNALNQAAGTAASGIIYDNRAFVLRYVIGV